MTPGTAELVMDILDGRADVAPVLERLRTGIERLDPWAPPPCEPGLLLSALAAATPQAIPAEIGAACATVLRRAQLTDTSQPGVDDVFRLLPLLVPTPAVLTVLDLIDEILQTPDLHYRWRRRITDVLAEIRFWRPEIINLDRALDLAERYPASERRAIFQTLVEPLALAAIATVTAAQLQRACNVAPDPVEARYLANAVGEHPDSPPDVRAIAARQIESVFPLRPIWKRLAGDHALRVLCIQNIADRQGDEIIRTVPLLQALLDAHPETEVTLITDRGYLYGHSRLTTISFDDLPERDAALNAAPDVLIDFFETYVRFLNYDPELAATVQQLRGTTNPPLDIRAGKGMNHFSFDSVRLEGMEWARALTLDRPCAASIYGPAFRLIAELGLPLRVGDCLLATESVLACRPWSRAEASWQAMTAANTDARPIALLNPFGGAGALKGFVARKVDDIAALASQLVVDGYFVVIVPTGSAETARGVINRLPAPQRAFTSIAPDPAASNEPIALDDRGSRTAPYASAIMRQTVTFVARANLIVTIEGWMIHAAYLLGKPFRLLMLAESHREPWQPWGDSTSQAAWLFTGNPALDCPPLPERPRRVAWLQLLQRSGDPALLQLLSRGLHSEDHDIRVAAARAVGQAGSREALPLLAGLLADPSHRVRGTAADMLLTHYRSACGSDMVPAPEILKPYRSIGGLFPNWGETLANGAAAAQALQATRASDDATIRRDAASILEHLSRTSDPNASPERKTT